MALSTQLSQLLIAFTIEFDNESERRMPRRTTSGAMAGSRRGPWLVSLVMWSNLMRFVGNQGVAVGELQDRAETSPEWRDGVRRRRTRPG